MACSYTGDDVIRLTNNEKVVLKMLLEDGRISDVDIANKLRVSSQAVSKIKRKLKSRKIIDGHVMNLDYGALGVNTFALALLETTEFEKCLEDEKVLKNSIGFYKVFKNDISHIGLFAFNNLEELDEYFDLLHSRHFDSITVKHVYTFPMKGLLKHSPNDLFVQMIKEFGKEKSPVPMSLDHCVEDRQSSKFKKLSATERNVLNLLLQNDKITCKGIASQLSLKDDPVVPDGVDMTISGVNKVKKRLEEKKVIKNYSVRLNYNRLGVNILSFIFVKKKKDGWDLCDGFFRGVTDSPNVIGCYKLNHGSSSVLFCGFRNLGELEYYCEELEAQNKNLLKVEKVYIASPSGIVRSSLGDIL